MGSQSNHVGRLARLVEPRSPHGVETGAGFDMYLEELSVLTESQYADVAFMRALDERFDIFH